MTHLKSVPSPSPSPSPAGRTHQAREVRPPVPPFQGTDHSGQVRRDGPKTCPTPGTDPIITNRSRPFFQHLRDLLIDGNWHHRDEVFTIGRQHGLADRTIANLLPRASKRRWISRSRGHVRIRDRAAFEAALDLMDGPA